MINSVSNTGLISDGWLGWIENRKLAGSAKNLMILVSPPFPHLLCNTITYVSHNKIELLLLFYLCLRLVLISVILSKSKLFFLFFSYLLIHSFISFSVKNQFNEAPPPSPHIVLKHSTLTLSEAVQPPSTEQHVCLLWLIVFRCELFSVCPRSPVSTSLSSRPRTAGIT